MLLTTDDEIRSLMPTSKWNDVDMLLSCVEEEEQNVVLNLLGDEHFLSVCHTTSSVILMNRRGKPPQMIFSPQIARLSSNTQFI